MMHRLLEAGRTVAATALQLPAAFSRLSIAAAVAWLAATAPAFGATFYVDESNPACSDAGPGTEAVPHCTINAAQAAHFGAGVTIAVKPGTYTELVNITKSGAAGNPFVFQALGPGVTLRGSFNASSRSWITIDGFTVEPSPGSTGIFVGSTPNSVITRNTVLNVSGPSGTSYGIYVSYAANQRIAGNTVANCEGHGFVIRNVTGSVIEDNASHHNDQGFNFKIDIPSPIGNVIRRNRAWSNATTGFYYFTVQGNVAIQNLAWSNGDHGIQHVNSRDNRHIGEVVWGNGDDGVSIKDGSTGNSFFNCILENNSVAANAYELVVDTTSTAGWASDDNVLWNSRRPVIKFGAASYATSQSFAQATGHDVRTRTQYPAFLDPATGDFRLMQNSPAIDCANTAVADWPAVDFVGQAPVDDAATQNTGTGSIDHADRGAFEFAPSGNPPVAGLQAHQASGGSLDYVLDASSSFDTDGPIRWYWFSFGDGWVSGAPQAAPSAAHTYAPGTWTATVTVVDTSGQMGTASITFTTGPAASAGESRFADFALGPMTPNPVGSLGRFMFSVPRASPVRVTVVDVQGRTIATLVDRVCEAGRHQASWDGATEWGRARPGLYFVDLEAAGQRIGRRFVLAR
jgi:parallel beta-helix repeat protein